MPGDEGAGLAARHKAEILEAVDRQMREACPWQRTGGVVDHQMVDIFVRDAGLGEGLGSGDAEGARGGEVFHLADHRRLDALAGAEQVDGGPLFAARGKLCGKSRARSAETRVKAPPPSVTRRHCNSRNGSAIIREFSTSSTVIGVLKVARGFLAAHSRCTTETIASCFCVRP